MAQSIGEDNPEAMQISITLPGMGPVSLEGAFPSSPLTMQRIALELGGGANVQRLNNARIDYRHDIHGSV
jgi:hypothetical protein